jgi:N-acetylneuraminic acid mutarotase
MKTIGGRRLVPGGQLSLRWFGSIRPIPPPFSHFILLFSTELSLFASHTWANEGGDPCRGWPPLPFLTTQFLHSSTPIALISLTPPQALIMFEVLLTKLESDLRTGFDQAVAGLVATTRRQLDDVLAEVAKERTKGLAEVAQERSDLHREIEVMHKHKEAQEGHVELNVGGYRFETSVQTLRRLPHTFFDAYFSGRYAQDVCADGSIFIDRDGEHFGQVLQYLRDGVVAVAEQEASDLDLGLLRWLKREFGFYCIELSAEEKAVEVSIMAVGGKDSDNKCISRAESCDASNNVWKEVASMSTERHEAAFCEQNGVLYATGGSDNDGEFLASVERYDMSLGTWSAAPAMPCPRSGHCACTMETDIYILGGSDNLRRAPQRTMLRFDRITEIWSQMSPMPEGRKLVAACVLGNNIFVLGGTDEEENVSATTYCFNGATGAWVVLAPMPEAKKDLRACVVGGLIYVIGGATFDTVVSSVHRFDFSANSWSVVAPLCNARLAFGAFVLDACMHVVGGYGSGRPRQPHFTGLTSAERYSVAHNSWSELPNIALSEARHSFGMVAMGMADEVNLFDYT